MGGLEAGCPWCDAPVSGVGVTCDVDCYALWYAWFWGHGDLLVVTGSGRLFGLGDGEVLPLDMVEQPWYAAVVGVGEGGLG